MTEHKPWQPKMDNQAELNPFVNSSSADRLEDEEIRDAEKDTAPLQGTHDLSDDDSLEDVIADDGEPRE